MYEILEPGSDLPMTLVPETAVIPKGVLSLPYIAALRQRPPNATNAWVFTVSVTNLIANIFILNEAKGS